MPKRVKACYIVKTTLDHFVIIAVQKTLNTNDFTRYKRLMNSSNISIISFSGIHHINSYCNVRSKVLIYSKWRKSCDLLAELY